MKLRLIGVVLAALALSACGGNPNEVGELTPYISTDLGFRVDYPANWDASTDPAQLVGERPDRYHAVVFVRQAANTTFVVFVQRLDGEEPLADFAARQMEGIRASSPDAVFSDPAPTQLGNLNALTTQTTVEQNGQTLTQRVVLAVKGQRGYALSLIAPARSPLNATLDEMLAAFIFLP